MNVMFSINAFGPQAKEATEIKKRIEDILKEYDLQGKVQGNGFEQFAQYSANFNK